MKWNGLVLTSCLAGLVLTVSISPSIGQSFAPRKNYDARLEPVDVCLHGLGQLAPINDDAVNNNYPSWQAFHYYCGAMPAGKRPVIYMSYHDLYRDAPVADNMDFIENHMRDLEAAFPELDLILQLGLDIHPEWDTANGRYDTELHTMCQKLNQYGRPVYIRIGYEFNGPWNGYDPAGYRQAFIRVTDIIRDNNVNAATVWCASPPPTEWEREAYYPGDEYVDWWSWDIFEAGRDCTDPKVQQFLTWADQHGKPVMIGESSAAGVGVHDGQADWNNFFVPYWNVIRNSPGVKAFCYIDWDWSRTPWSGWGDCRVEANPVVLSNWIQETASPLIAHAPYGFNLPPAPDNLDVSVISPGVIYLTWRDNGHGNDQEDGFTIERKPLRNNPDQWYEVGLVGPDTTDYIDTDSIHGLVDYTYRVGAYRN